MALDKFVPIEVLGLYTGWVLNKKLDIPHESICIKYYKDLGNAKPQLYGNNDGAPWYDAVLNTVSERDAGKTYLNSSDSSYLDEFCKGIINDNQKNDKEKVIIFISDLYLGTLKKEEFLSSISQILASEVEKLQLVFIKLSPKVGESTFDFVFYELDNFFLDLL